MKLFYNLKTSQKLITSFVFLTVIMAFVGLYGLSNLGLLRNELNQMYYQRLVPTSDFSDAQILYQRIRINVRDVNLANTKEEEIKYEQTITELRSELERIIEKSSKLNLSQEEKQIIKDFGPAWQTYTKLLDQAIELSFAGKDQEFIQLLTGELRRSGDKINAMLDQLIEANNGLAEKANKDAETLYTQSRLTTIAVLVLAMLVSIGLGYGLARMISKPLNKMVALASKVAGGDLRETSVIDTKDEVGQLARSMNDMVLNLRATVGDIQASAESVSAAAQQISASTEEIASGSASQSNDVQTMNALFTDLSKAIGSVAESAEQASLLTNRMLHLAQEGNQVVITSMEGMNAVKEQIYKLEHDSNLIGDIIEVIEEISDQTNLLALNAAIEAARAGEQGRGFAVVADEVRKLAERSGESTKQITAIIRGIQHNTRSCVDVVENGVVSSQKTGHAFNDIIAAINQSVNMVADIAAASEEQAAQTSEVLTSIRNISSISQEAAAASEETAATSQSLAHLAEGLYESVSTFRIK